MDFSYEVSRSIAACEGALLIVDATQGIQAQTISNLYLAIDNNLEIIPVLNKMDMPNAMPEEVKDQIEELIGCERDDIIEASGKTGLGVDKILEAVVERIPAPTGVPMRHFRLWCSTRNLTLSAESSPIAVSWTVVWKKVTSWIREHGKEYDAMKLEYYA